MSGSVAIENNRVALVRIVASLVAMAGLARVGHLPPEASNQGRSADVDAAAETGRRVGSGPPRAGVLAQEVADGRNDPTRFAPLRGPQRPPHEGEVRPAPTIHHPPRLAHHTAPAASGRGRRPPPHHRRRAGHRGACASAAQTRAAVQTRAAHRPPLGTTRRPGSLPAPLRHRRHWDVGRWFKRPPPPR